MFKNEINDKQNKNKKEKGNGNTPLRGSYTRCEVV